MRTFLILVAAALGVLSLSGCAPLVVGGVAAGVAVHHHDWCKAHPGKCEYAW